jgi:hypothetical protein
VSFSSFYLSLFEHVKEDFGTLIGGKVACVVALNAADSADFFRIFFILVL